MAIANDTPQNRKSHSSTQVDAVLRLAKNNLHHGIVQKNIPAQADAYSGIAEIFTTQGQFDSSIWYLNQAKQIFKGLKKEEEVAKTNIALSDILIMQSRVDDAMHCLLEADSLSFHLNYAYLHAKIKWKLGVVYKVNEDYAQAILNFKEALSGFEKLNDRQNYLLVGNSLSTAYRLSGSADSSLLLLQHNARIFKNEQVNDASLFASLQENFGDTYIELGRYNQAIPHFRDALNYYLNQQSITDITYQKYSIGRCLAEMNRFQEAEPYLIQSYKLSDSLKNFKYLLWISNVLQNMYAKEGNWEHAYTYLKEKISWQDSIDFESRLQKSLVLSKQFESRQKAREIAMLKDKAQLMKWAFISGILLLLIAALIIWLLRSRRRIREEKILNYFATSLYNQNSIDDVFWDIAKNCVSKLGIEDCVIYGYDEAKNVLVQKAAFGPKNPEGYEIEHYIEIPMGKGIVGWVAETKVAEIVNDVRKDSRYITDDQHRLSEIAVPILVEDKLIGVIDSENSRKGFYRQNHLRIFQKIADICSKKITRHLVEDGVRKIISRDLHDDIGSALTSISIASKLAIQKSKMGVAPDPYLYKINAAANSMMESMSDIVWAIKPGNDTFDNTIAHMKEFASELCEPIGVSLQWESPDALNPKVIPANIKKNLFLVFKEAVHNAVKYSQCSKIAVRFNQAGPNRIFMLIADDGKGFKEENIKPGNGLRNMRERAAQMNASFHMDSSASGTKVELDFSL